MSALTQADWYVDYVSGNDANDGTTPLTAVKTVMGGVVAQWGTVSPLLEQTTTIHILTPQPLDAEAIVLSPVCVGKINFVIQGTLQPVASGSFTLATVTSKDRAANTTLSATGFPGTVAVGHVVHNTTHDSYAFVREMTSGTATLTQPIPLLVPGSASPYDVPAEVDTWTAGDAVVVYSLPGLNLRGFNPTGFGESSSNLYDGLAWIDSVDILDSAPATSSFDMNNTVSVAHLVHFAPALYTNVSYCAFINCHFEGGLWLDGQGQLFAGMQHGYYPCAVYGAGWVFDCDCYFENLYINAPTEIFHVEIGNDCTTYPAGIFLVNTIVWGAGTVSLYEGGCVANERDDGVWATALPIAGGMTFERNPSGTGSAYDDTTGLWTGQIAPTIANLTTYNSLVNPLSGSRYYRSMDS